VLFWQSSFGIFTHPRTKVITIRRENEKKETREKRAEDWVELD